MHEEYRPACSHRITFLPPGSYRHTTDTWLSRQTGRVVTAPLETGPRFPFRPLRPTQFLGGTVAVAAAVVFFFVWELLHRGVYAYSTASYPFNDADEWRYTACSRLVERGYSLFDQVFSAQPPLYFVSLASGMRVFGDSIAGARTTGVLFGALALLASAWVAWELAGPAAAAVAAIVLAISPAFLIYSHAVEAEVPMMAVTTLSLALALSYRRTGRIPLLVLSGLALAAATLIKLFAVEAVLPVLWLISLQRSSLREFIRPTAIFGAATVMPVLVELALVSPRQQWQQVITLHNRIAGLQLPNQDPARTTIVRFLTFDAGLTLLAIAGILTVILARRVDETGFLALWLGGTVAMLLVFRPLFPHHPAILSSSLAVCAGVGAGTLLQSWRHYAWSIYLPLGIAGVAYLAFVPRLAHLDRHTLIAPPPSILTHLAGYLQRTTPSTAFVAVDDLQVADQAHRLVPPPLCDPSNVRLKAGFLTADDLISATRQYHARVVVALANFSAVPGYMQWLKAHYRPVTLPGRLVVYRL